MEVEVLNGMSTLRYPVFRLKGEKMKITTRFHGTKEYEEKDIITFSKGIPGFENLKKFILFPVEENEVFNVLQSIEDVDMGLIVISPFEIVKDYEFKLEDNLIERLNIREPQQVLVVNTVTLNSKVENITVNLKAPIVINIKEGSGEQLILDTAKYSIKHPLIQEE
jgi:flagellar assembly factor FliW